MSRSRNTEKRREQHQRQRALFAQRSAGDFSAAADFRLHRGGKRYGYPLRNFWAEYKWKMRRVDRRKAEEEVRAALTSDDAALT